MTNKELRILASVALGTMVFGQAAYDYVKVTRKERKKRKKLAAWEREVFACINVSREKLSTYVNSPEFTYEGFITLLREEDQFITLVMNQPMY